MNIYEEASLRLVLSAETTVRQNLALLEDVEERGLPGSYLRHRLSEEGIGTTELARITGFSRGFIGRVISGNKPLSPALIAAIDKATKITSGELAHVTAIHTITCPGKDQDTH